jgi:hypothetical protein
MFIGFLSGVALGEGLDLDTTTVDPRPTRLTAPDRTGQPDLESRGPREVPWAHCPDQTFLPARIVT